MTPKVYSTVHDVTPALVASTHEEIYDPTHPDADWSGLVYRKCGTRKHERVHASLNVGIVQTDEGIVSKIERSEFPKKSRNHNPIAPNTSNIIGM